MAGDSYVFPMSPMMQSIQIDVLILPYVMLIECYIAISPIWNIHIGPIGSHIPQPHNLGTEKHILYFNSLQILRISDPEYFINTVIALLFFS